MPGDEPFRLLLIGATVIQIAISAHYIRISGAGATVFQRRDEGVLLSAAIAVCYLLYALSVLAFLVNPAWMSWSAVAAPAGLRWLGAAVLALGAALLIWGLHHLDRQLTISISTKENHALVTTGPYRWVRHPLYTGGMIESVGVVLLVSNWLVAVSAAAFWALIAYRTPLEEQKLIDAFGEDYRLYMRQVGRFLPSRSPKSDA